MKRILIAFSLVCLISVLILPFPSVEGRVKAYYSGSTVAYNDKIVIATTNTGVLEVFVADENSTIKRLTGIKSTGSRFKPADSFNDCLLNIENERLFVYSVDSYAIYKYDITDLTKAQLVKKVENTIWNWQGSLMEVEGKVATVGSKGIAIWNSNLEVIDSYPIVTSETWDNPYNAAISNDQKYIFSITNKEISIFDRETRTFTKTVPLNVKWENRWYPHAIYNDNKNGSIYVVDDEAVRKINFNGEIEKSFKHTGKFGFDVVPSADRKSIYFSDGIGIVSLDADTLAVRDYAYTDAYGGYGGWAMGLNSVSINGKEFLVLFNGNGIVILDNKFNLLKGENSVELTIPALEEETKPNIIEPTSLGINLNHATPNSQLNLHGKGFGSNERLVINFGGSITEINADYFGQFQTNILVPNIRSGPVDIKVVGQESKISYSLGFKVD